MIRGIYISASGMLAAQTRLDVAAHNVANANTTGYRRQMVTFAPLLEAAVWRHGARPEPIGRAGLGTVPVALVTEFSGGPLTETGCSGDLALDGEGFFTVDRGGEQLYTRNGSFLVDEHGNLVTRAGDPVLGEQGPIHVGEPGFLVTPDGRVISAAGEEAGRLLLTALVGGDGSFERTADGYLIADSSRTQPARDVQVRQGFLEGANASLAEEMVDILTAARAYAANQRLIRIHDGLLEKAVNQVAAVR